MLFRLSVGAIPFLLPRMLQVGFGLSAFASGSLTFASAVGAVTMKLTASPILRRYGFKRVLCVNAVISSVLLLACALFSAATPPAVIITVLLVGGFFRSLQFTSLNTLGYADITGEPMSRATSFVGMVQQLSLAARVALAALLLETSRTADARSRLLAVDFGRAFVTVGLLSLLSLVFHVRLAPHAGAEMSGLGPVAAVPANAATPATQPDQPSRGPARCISPADRSGSPRRRPRRCSRSPDRLPRSCGAGS